MENHDKPQNSSQHRGNRCGLSGFPLVATWWARTRPNPAPPFAFPTADLAALDRDVQARFAVVPEKDFGIERAYGNQHYLYNPSTPAERATVAALKKQNTEAAFYLMSRALWLRSWDGWGFKPIQGPVSLTGKVKAPIPRQVNFITKDYFTNKNVPLNQEGGYGADGSREEGLATHNPAGTPVAAPTPPTHAPRFNQLQQIGNEVFEMVENAPHNARIGANSEWKNWKIVAVPIRASQKACIGCHVYQPYASPKPPGKLKVEVGDALGVAFYAYRPAINTKSIPK